MGEKKDKLVFVATCAEEHPEKATIPFVLANAALAMDVEAVVVLQMTGVYLAMNKYARHVQAGGFPPLQELMEAFLEEGGKIYVCDPCIQVRQIEPSELIEGAEIVAGALLIDAFMEARNVVVY